MSELSTYLLVGKDQYVRFEERFGSKDFFTHVWDTNQTPLSAEELDKHTFHTELRLNPQTKKVEFPILKRRGNSYKPTGSWCTWERLSRLNPLVVKPPPDVPTAKKISSPNKTSSGDSIVPKESKRNSFSPPKKNDKKLFSKEGTAERSSETSRWASPSKHNPTGSQDSVWAKPSQTKPSPEKEKPKSLLERIEPLPSHESKINNNRKKESHQHENHQHKHQHHRRHIHTHNHNHNHNHHHNIAHNSTRRPSNELPKHQASLSSALDNRKEEGSALHLLEDLLAQTRLLSSQPSATSTTASTKATDATTETQKSPKFNNLSITGNGGDKSTNPSPLKPDNKDPSKSPNSESSTNKVELAPPTSVTNPKEDMIATDAQSQSPQNHHDISTSPTDPLSWSDVSKEKFNWADDDDVDIFSPDINVNKPGAPLSSPSPPSAPAPLPRPARSTQPKIKRMEKPENINVSSSFDRGNKPKPTKSNPSPSKSIFETEKSPPTTPTSRKNGNNNNETPNASPRRVVTNRLTQGLLAGTGLTSSGSSKQSPKKQQEVN